MSRRRWQQIILTIPEAHQELLIGQLTLLPFEGFLQEKNRLTCTLEQKQWTKALERRLRFVLTRFQTEFPELDLSFSTETLHEQNWNARWEKSVGIVEATPRILIKPSWKKLRRKDSGKIVLHIDPKMSFGTGHHETTRLCLGLLERYLRKGMKVLDVGCGTGVLAIAAIKLGAARAVGIDQDDWAVLNAKENVKRNGVSRKVAIHKGGLEAVPGKIKFDVIVSNIDFNTNLDLLPGLQPFLPPGGVLILSGFLTEHADSLNDFLKHRNLIPHEFVVENGWAALAAANVDAT